MKRFQVSGFALVLLLMSAVLFGASAGSNAGAATTQVLLADGTAKLPALGFSSLNTLGLRKSSTNIVFSSAEVDRLSVGTAGVGIGAGGTAITKHLSATATWDPASTADAAFASTTVTVTGAAVGDTVAVGFSTAVPAGCILTGSVTAANTVTVTFANESGGTLDLASGTLRADVWKH